MAELTTRGKWFVIILLLICIITAPDTFSITKVIHAASCMLLGAMAAIMGE